MTKRKDFTFEELQERGRRELELEHAINNPQFESDEGIAALVADWYVFQSEGWHPTRRWRVVLSILNMTDARPIPFMWKRKNMRGIVTTEKEVAREWTVKAMLAGYAVFYSSNRHGGSGKGSIDSIRERASEGIAR